ncbi:MAG: hypothetical protein KDJ45_08840 [Hyphomicrobiaceae bacterium]|nr:hypothetical protein [Hyphomicrobiaceae bacterium]
MGATSKRLSEYQNAVKKRFYKIDTGLSALHSGVQRLNQSMDSLRTAVGENQAALQGLAAISYSGWSTQQKLQAVRSGSFPGLEGASREATIKALEDQAAVERTAAHLQSVSQDFSDLATIAANIGLPKDLVNGLQGAQVVANGFAAFASGNYLGAVASLTSLVGLGGPDAATQRHEQLMKYLGAQFEQINKKLDYIIDLQKKTLEAIDALAKAQISFRKEVMAKLDKIEGIVLQNNVFLQRIVISKWDSCHAIAYGPMNGLFSLETPASLQKILRWDVLSTMTADCYDTLVKFFDANVKPASWAGQIIAAQEFPTSKIEDNPSLQKHIRALQAQRERAFETARKFLMASIASTQYSLGKPAYLLARLQQPMPDVASAKTLNDALSEPKTRAALESFRCADSTLSHALQTLICVNAADGSNPVEATFRSLLNAPRIGPQAYWIMDLGQVMSTIVDFGVRDNSGNFSFATPEELSRFASVGQSALLRKAVEKGKGIDLLRRLQLLSEAVLLQDALSFGDLTAELVMAALYDPATKALVTDPKALASDIKRQLAVDAMKMNPLLAHNVVMLAMRRSIEQALGGREKANEVLHRRTAYQLALNSYDKRGACSGSSAALQGLKNLFPNWQFEYRVTATDRADAALKSCPEEVVDNLEDVSAPPALGHGPAVTVGDFYVLLPSAPVLSQGMFEQSDNLNLALRYRDKLSQAVIDRRLGSIVSSIDATERNVVALGLLSEGWPATTTLPHQ